MRFVSELQLTIFIIGHIEKDRNDFGKVSIMLNGRDPVRVRVSVLLLLATCAMVSGVVSIDPGSLGANADVVVFGTVTSVESAWTDDHREIETVALVSVEEVLKGAPGTTLRVVVSGGAVDGLVEVVEGEPSLVQGQRGYFSLVLERPGRYRFADGSIGVVPKPYASRKKILKSAGDSSAGTRGTSAWPVITSVSPQIASAGTATEITITGTGFGTKASRDSTADVGFTAHDGIYWASGYPNFTANANDIISWTDTQIRVRVPFGYLSDGRSYSSASSGIVWVLDDADKVSNEFPFSVTFAVTPHKWSTAPLFSVNNNCPGTTGGAAAIRGAAAAWNTVLPSTFQFSAAGSSTKTAVAFDGINLVAWGSKPKSTVFYYEDSGLIGEVDIVLNASSAWTTGTASGSTMNVESWMLNRFGFGLGMQSLYGTAAQGPSDAGKALSYYRDDALGNANLLTLHAADRAGANYLYGGGSANPSLLAAAFTTDTITGAAPLDVQFMDASLGGATGWSWDFGDGASSTQRNPAHIYTTPGTYTVVLTASAAGYPSDTIRAVNHIRVNATAAVVTVPGGSGVPRDLDGDGKYEDVNGNGRKDFADVTLYFTQMTWIAGNEPLTAFDYNGNGRIDFADVSWLFTHL
jgi:PKD repeat protein